MSYSKVVGHKCEYLTLLRQDLLGHTLEPPLYGCPECAMQQDVEAQDVRTADTIQNLRNLNINNRVIVYDPVTWRVMLRESIAFIGTNGPDLQVSLIQGRWASLDDMVVRRETVPGFAAYYEDFHTDDAHINSVVEALRELHHEGRLILWDPDSRKLISGPLISKIGVNGDSVQISMSEDWPMDFGVRAVLEGYSQ